MKCMFFYNPELRCNITCPHVHGMCSACGDWAVTYFSRWTHVGEPCAPRRDGKWVAERGADLDVRFVAGRPRSEAAA
mgnify:CR=1 FL=1